MTKHIILYLAASPDGVARVASDEEARAIKAELERNDYGDCFDFRASWAAQPNDLLHEVRKLKPTVVHFSGHGSSDWSGRHRQKDQVLPRDVAGEPCHVEHAQQCGLIFQDPDRHVQLVSAAALEHVFRATRSSVRLVVLNACYTDELASVLLTHIDCVVGMRGPILDDAAKVFAKGFYGGLAQGEPLAAAWDQGRAAIRLEVKGAHEADRPQLKVRAGVDASKLILAEEPTAAIVTPSRQEFRLSAGRLPALNAALLAAFKGRRLTALIGAFTGRRPKGLQELRELALRYRDIGLPAELPGENASIEDFVHDLLWISHALGQHVLESVVRGARRKRPDHAKLVEAITETWSFAGGLDFRSVDELRTCLRAAGVAEGRLRDVTLHVLGRELPPLWEPLGTESFDDLIEGLAQLGGHPPKLVLISQHLRDIPGVAAWIQRVAPGTADPGERNEQAFRGRMLLLLRRGVNDLYKGEIYLSEPDGTTSFVAPLHAQASLAEIPAMFVSTRTKNEDLRRALFGRRLAAVEIMLPVRDLLTDVERWDLFGSGPIGRHYPVIVKPLERAFAIQHDEYLGGSMLLEDSRDVLRRTPSMRRLKLELEQVNAAIRDHPTQWCVATFHCSDPARAGHLEALETLVKCGVAAMLAIRHDHDWPDHLEANTHLPSSVHDHRRAHPEHPVTLLWDDGDFIPGSTK